MPTRTSVDRVREIVALPADDYYSIGWTDGSLVVAVAGGGPGESIVVAEQNGQERQRFKLPTEGTNCLVRSPAGFSKLPTGEVALSAVCASEGGPPSSELLAFSSTTGLRSLGTTKVWAGSSAWTADMSSVTYSAGGALCTTLYVRDARADRPLSATVSIRGTQVPLGEDIEAADDRCTHLGQADWPALSPDGQLLALFAMPSLGVSGQERSDMPWALVLDGPTGPRVVLDGVREPRGVGWLTNDALVFAGYIGDEPGLWTVRTNGTEFTRVGDDLVDYLAVASSQTVLVILHDRDAATVKLHYSNTIGTYDLASVLQPTGNGATYR